METDHYRSTSDTSMLPGRVVRAFMLAGLLLAATLFKALSR